MDDSVPTRAELRHLLDSVGIETIFGATPDKLPALSAEAQQALDREGLLGLAQEGLVTVDPDALRNDPTLAQMLQVLRAPTAVVRVRRTQFGQQPEIFWCAIAGNKIVHLSGVAPGPYRLAYLADTDILLRLIEEFLPLTAVQAAAYARADLAAGDATAVWDLAAEGGAVAAGQLLKAVGLSQEDAEDFYDALRAADFRGRINFIAVRAGRISRTRGLWIAQSGDLPWLASIEEGKDDTLRLETALPGVYRQALESELDRCAPVSQSREGAEAAEKPSNPVSFDPYPCPPALPLGARQGCSCQPAG